MYTILSRLQFTDRLIMRIAIVRRVNKMRKPTLNFYMREQNVQLNRIFCHYIFIK